MVIMKKKSLSQLFSNTRKKVFLLSLVSAIFLLLATFVFQSFLILHSNAEGLITRGNFFRKSILKMESKPDAHTFLFVNTSYNNEIVHSSDNPFGNEVIVDRSDLAELLTYLSNDNSYKYIILDIFFKAQSEDDSLLQNALLNTKRLIACSQLDSSMAIDRPIFDMNCGLCEVETVNDLFLKYSLTYEDTLESLPLLAYRALNGGGYPKKKKFAIRFNDFILNYRIRDYDLNSQKYLLTNLCDLLFLGEDAIRDFSRERIVVIGDLVKNDKFSTVMGSISGPLLLTNVLLALEHGDNEVGIVVLAVLLLVFFGLSYLAIYPDDLIQRWIEKKIGDRPLLKSIFKGLSFGFLLSLVWLLIFLFFELQLSFLWLVTYFLLVDYFSTRKKPVKC